MNLSPVRLIPREDGVRLLAHPFALVMPPMDEEAMRLLTDSIEIDGQLSPITLYQGRVLDGRHRVVAFHLREGRPTIAAQDFEGTDAEALRFVIAQNARRRHFRGPSQAAMVAARLVTTRPHVSAAEGDITQAMAAEMVGVSERYVRLAMRIVAAGAPDIAEAVFNGAMTLTAALRAIQPPEVVERADPLPTQIEPHTAAAVAAMPLAVDELLAEDDPVGWVQRLAPAEAALRVLRLARFARLALDAAEEEYGDAMMTRAAPAGALDAADQDANRNITVQRGGSAVGGARLQEVVDGIVQEFTVPPFTERGPTHAYEPPSAPAPSPRRPRRPRTPAPDISNGSND